MIKFVIEGQILPIIIFFIKNISRQDFTVFNRKIKEKTGRKNATNHIIQAISMTVQSGNATSIMGTLEPLRKLEDVSDVISPREEKL